MTIFLPIYCIIRQRGAAHSGNFRHIYFIGNFATLAPTKTEISFKFNYLTML